MLSSHNSSGQVQVSALYKEIESLKESKQTAVEEMRDLKSENARLRDFIMSLEAENKKLVQERDSLSFALQIISSDLTPSTANNNDLTPKKTTIMKSQMLMNLMNGKSLSQKTKKRKQKNLVKHRLVSLSKINP